MNPLIPAYGTGTLADIPRSVLAAFGGDAPNTLNLEPADKVCLFLVDGMGADLLAAHPRTAPFLTAALGRTLNAGFPSSTPTSLASLSIGVPPGEHGMLGITMAVPGEHRLFHCLRWTTSGPPIDPYEWQPARTVYQDLTALGVDSAYVAPGIFDGSGLSKAVQRGVRHVHADDLDERVEGARAAFGSAARVYVTVYYGGLDAAGHRDGWGSEGWLAELATVDRLAERLADALPPGAVMYVTADHGMVNAATKIDLDVRPDLTAGLDLIGGEARVRHLYTLDGAAPSVLAAWREGLSGECLVLSREQAVDEGWFGPIVKREWLERIGDVVAVSYGDTVVIPAKAEPHEWSMIGYHGSLTAAEQNVPLIEIRR